MMLVRRLARPLLAGYFVARGARLLRNPREGEAAAELVRAPLTDRFSFLPKDAASLVRLNAGVQAGAGLLLATGRLPRLSALALAGSTVPTAAARHPFWQQKDPQQRAVEQNAFLADLSILGGLLLAAVDTSGDPSLAWRARHAAKATTRSTKRSTRQAVAAGKQAVSAGVREAASARKVTREVLQKAPLTRTKKSGFKAAAAAVRDKLPV